MTCRMLEALQLVLPGAEMIGSIFDYLFVDFSSCSEAHITHPLAAMNIKIGNFLANPQALDY